MEELKMLEIFKRIENCIKTDSLYEVKNLIRIEIENLKGITKQKCKNTKYHFYGTYCKYCENFNCDSNKNISI